MLKVEATIETQRSEGCSRRIVCPHCNAMMLQALQTEGESVLRVKCRRCKSMVLVKICEV